MELGMGEIVVVLVVALILLGPSKLPKLGDALGRGIRNFKRATEGVDEPSTTGTAAEPAPRASALPPVADAAAQGEGRKGAPVGS